MSGREPLFCWGRLECGADRLRSGSLYVDLEKIRGAAERVARSEGLEVVDVEWKVGKQRFLRVYIDVEDLIPGPAGYTLEVSSPGMDRALKKPADFERFRGRLAKISTSEPVGEAKFFEGRLAGFADGKVRVELKGKEAQTVEVPLETIRKANLVVEF